MFVIYNKFFPFGGFKMCNILTCLFTKSRNISQTDLNHEKIHSCQMIETAILITLLIGIVMWLTNCSLWWSLLGILSFYAIYGLETLIIWFFHTTFHGAYRDVSFEEEAYNHDHDLNYIQNRKLFNWVKYFRIKDNN